MRVVCGRVHRAAGLPLASLARLSGVRQDDAHCAAEQHAQLFIEEVAEATAGEQSLVARPLGLIETREVHGVHHAQAVAARSTRGFARDPRDPLDVIEDELTLLVGIGIELVRRVRSGVGRFIC